MGGGTRKPDLNPWCTPTDATQAQLQMAWGQQAHGSMQVGM